MQVRSLGWEDPLEEEMATCSSILAGKFHGQTTTAGYSPWSHKESDMTKHAHVATAAQTILLLNTLQPVPYSCWDNSMDRGWQATVHGVAKSWI